MRSFLSILLLTSASLALAAETPCEPGPDRQPGWACILCGPNADQFCQPYNATFDELVPGKAVGNYDNMTWTNFIAEDNLGLALGNHLVPYSHCNFARLPAGRNGVLQGPGGALLFNFHYGCTTPWIASGMTVIQGNPVDCVVSLSAYCGYARSVASLQRWSWNFTADLSPSTQLAFTNGNEYLGPGYGGCTNYTFSARSTTGMGVDLFLDDVIFKREPSF